MHTIYPGSIRTNVSRNALTADGSAARGLATRRSTTGSTRTKRWRRCSTAIANDEREIVVAVGVEQAMGEARRTPEALFDQIAALMARGYAEQMKAEAQ